MLHTIMHHTDLYIYTKFHWNQRKFLWTYGRTYGHISETHFIRSTRRSRPKKRWQVNQGPIHRHCLKICQKKNSENQSALVSYDDWHIRWDKNARTISVFGDQNNGFAVWRGLDANRATLRQTTVAKRVTTLQIVRLLNSNTNTPPYLLAISDKWMTMT